MKRKVMQSKAAEDLFPNSQKFKSYSETLKAHLALIKNFSPSKIRQWEIDWKSFETAQGRQNKTKKELSIFSELRKERSAPAIYFFKVGSRAAEDVYKAFFENRSVHATIKRTKGVTAEGFLNICFVPKEFKKSDCLYVGSIKNNLEGRLKSHLGLGSSGRTGALHLDHNLKSFKKRPQMVFYYMLLPVKYKSVTEHIERVFQEHLKPFLGQKVFKSVVFEFEVTTT